MYVTKNVGMIERLGRGTLGFALIAAGMQSERGALGRAFLVTSGIKLMITSVTGHCTGNSLLRRNTFPDALDRSLHLDSGSEPGSELGPGAERGVDRGPAVPQDHVAFPHAKPEAPDSQPGLRTGDF
jgi:hypothetical protein